MVSESSPMTLDDEVEPLDGGPAKDVDGVPYCRKHHCRMKQSSGGKKSAPTAYYTCPVPKCDAKAQKIKTPRECVVPPLPIDCKHCKKSGREVFCERDDKCSTGASVILKCPECGWKSGAMAVPQLAAAHFARRERPQSDRIGDR